MIDLAPPLILPLYFAGKRPAIIRPEADPLRYFPVDVFSPGRRANVEPRRERPALAMLPGMVPIIVSSGPLALTSIAFQTSAVSGTDTIMCPTVQLYDVGVLFDYAGNSSGGDASLVVPSGFTQLNTAPGGGSGGRGTVSYRVFDGTESGSTLTGQNGNFINNKLILVFRPNGAINTVTSSTWLGEMTNGDPSSQAISASGQAAPLIRLACLGNSNASQDDFSAGSFDATVVGATPASGRIRAGYALQISSPSSNTVDITDLGTLNWLTSGWLSFA